MTESNIRPTQAEKTLQQLVNEVCEKHGVSTIQDLDWAFCATEQRLEDNSKEFIKLCEQREALEKLVIEKSAEIERLKNKLTIASTGIDKSKDDRIEDKLFIEEISEPQIFDPPKRMLVWSYKEGKVHDACMRDVVAILPELPNHANILCLYDGTLWWATHCGMLKEEAANETRT